MMAPELAIGLAMGVPLVGALLIGGGALFRRPLMIETVFDKQNRKVAIFAMDEHFLDTKKERLPVMLVQPSWTTAAVRCLGRPSRHSMSVRNMHEPSLWASTVLWVQHR